MRDQTYLELIAPDPNRNISEEDLFFNLGQIKSPKIITWAVRTTDLDSLGKMMRLTNIQDGGRVTENGAHLKWKTAEIVEYSDQTGMIPFVIQWGDTPHPAGTSPQGCQLLEFSAEHPTPNQLNKLLSEILFPFKIDVAQSFKLKLKINSPKGVVSLDNIY